MYLTIGNTKKNNTAVPLIHGGYFKTLGGCLKLWIIPNPIYTGFSYTYSPIIKFNL